jgi:hypothetical protein
MIRISVLLLVSLTAIAASAQTSREPGALLRDGPWNGDIGTYVTPDAFQNLKARQWPKQGWYSLILHPTHIQSERINVSKGATPPFLQPILEQVEGVENGQFVTSQATEQTDGSNYIDQLYLRVPGTVLREGKIPLLTFKSGHSTLQPRLEYRYKLELNGMPFSVFVRNGFRSKSGVPYGEGTRYFIEYGGQTYRYNLGGYGWDSTIKAITDLDGDGRPDFVIAVGASNSSVEVVLLSSKAKPGSNPPTASLVSTGC